MEIGIGRKEVKYAEISVKCLLGGQIYINK